MSDMTVSRPVAEAAPEARTQFMLRVYAHVVGGIVAFILLQWWMFDTGLAYTIFDVVAQTNWLLILGGFMIVTWMASRLSAGARSPGVAYAGYGLLVLANALLFAAPLVLANEFAEGAISTAAQLSILAFIGLSVVAVKTSKDFSFLRGILMWGGILALVLIAGSVIFGAQLGTWFAVAMIGLAGGAILYDTQRIYHSFPPEAVVPAAMHLFSSLALLFWYVLQLVMARE